MQREGGRAKETVKETVKETARAKELQRERRRERDCGRERKRRRERTETQQRETDEREVVNDLQYIIRSERPFTYRTAFSGNLSHKHTLHHYDV